MLVYRIEQKSTGMIWEQTEEQLKETKSILKLTNYIHGTYYRIKTLIKMCVENYESDFVKFSYYRKED